VNIVFYSIPRHWNPVTIGLAALLLAACLDRPAGVSGTGAAATDWSNARDVAIVLAEYRFIPSQLGFERGVAYRLRLENRGGELHEFTAPDFLAAIELRDPGMLTKAKNEIVLAPRTEKLLYFVARRPGRYALTCADHDWAGMVGTIIIE
jgi:uncharacterized cupredoxin-like copper-binding protein